MQLNIDYDPSFNPGQVAFHASGAKYKAMVGGLGSGKSTSLIAEVIMLLLEYPGITGLLCRKALPDLKATTLQKFFEMMPPELIISHNKLNRVIEVKTSGKPSLLRYGPLEDASRYKSLEIGFLAIDEGDEITEDNWMIACGRLRQKDMPHVGMLATNPTSKNHWIYKRWAEEPTKDYELFKSKTEDNARFLPPGYIDDLKANYPVDWQKRYLEGEFGALLAGDPCFPDFSTTFHVKHLEPIKGLPMIRGWDFGFRRPCVVFAQFDNIGRFLVYSCILGDNEDIHEFSDRIIRYSNQRYPGMGFTDYCDPAGVQRKDDGQPSVKVLNQKNIFPKSRRTTPDQRATELRSMMRKVIQGDPAFQITKENTYLIDAFLGGYQIDNNGKPRKDGFYEHGMDALGYIVANTCMISKGVKKFNRISVSEPSWGKSKRWH